MSVEYDFVIKQGDTKPVFTETLLDETGAPVNLTGCSVNWVMRSLTGTAPVINAPATIVDATAGMVTFTFTAAQTAIAGTFMGTFLITFTDETTRTFPVDGYLEVNIQENLLTAGGAQIVSLAEVKDNLNIPATNRDADSKIVRLIGQITPVVEHITGPILLKDVEEWHTGGQTFIELREPPVANLLNVTIYVGLTPFEMAIIEDPAHGTTYSVLREPESAIVTRRTTGGAVTPFPNGPEAVHVWYQAGRNVVPQNVTLGMLDLVKAEFMRTQRGGPKFTGGQFTRDDDEPGVEILGFFVPNSVREKLAPSRRSIGLH